MTHAAPTYGRTTGYARTPDVFGERTHAVAKWAIPLGFALIYGYWASANIRYGGPITGGNVLFGLLTALVFLVLCTALVFLGPHLRRELHAVLWAAFTGSAVGFLFSLSGRGHTVLESTALGVWIAVPTFAVLFYRYYTHEDAAGHRIR